MVMERVMDDGTTQTVVRYGRTGSLYRGKKLDLATVKACKKTAHESYSRFARPPSRRSGSNRRSSLPCTSGDHRTSSYAPERGSSSLAIGLHDSSPRCDISMGCIFLASIVKRGFSFGRLWPKDTILRR
ncbi:hypothetical protein Pfo_020305 [Paulownia fortunei]|nr:hypothetical protein Pfo_020305 [Paulownia fortunei]